MAIAELDIAIDLDESNAISGLIKLQDTFTNMLDNLQAGISELQNKWNLGFKTPTINAPNVNPTSTPTPTPETSAPDTSPLDVIQQKLSNIGTQASLTGMALTQTLTQPIIDVGTAAFQSFSSFETAMSGVATVTSGTSESMTQLRDLAMTIGTTTKYSADEAAAAMYYMGSAGWNTNQIITGLTAVTTLATAAKVDLATASEFCTSSMAAFGLTADQTSMFTDVLATAAAKSNTDITGMAGAFKYVAPVAGAMGYSIQDVALAIGLMSNASVKGEQAGTSLRGALNGLISPSTEAASTMQSLGVSMTDSQGKALPLGTVLTQLRTSFSGLSEEQKVQAASTIFGQEAMSGMLAVINSSDSDFNNLKKSLDDSEGAAKKMADTMGNNAPSKIERLNAKIKSLGIDMGEKLGPAIEKVVDFISKLVTWFSNLDSTTQTVVLVFIGLLAAIGPIATIIGGVCTIASTLMGIFSALGSVISFLGGVFAFLCTPVGLVVAAITAAIAVGVLLWQNWDKISAWAIKLWQDIVNAWNNIKNSTQELYNAMVSKWDEIKQAIINGVQKAIDWIKSVNLYDVGVSMIKGLINGIVSMAQSIGNAVVNTVKGAIDGAKKFLGIASPSKLMMEMGINTGKGLVMGLDKTYDDVMNASLGLSKSVTDGYKQSNPQNITSNLTINVRSPSEIYKEINFLNRALVMGL